MVFSLIFLLDIVGLSLDHPAGDRLEEIEWPWHGHVRLEVFEARLLQRAIRRHVESIRLTE
jgi:hypothetical protein